MNSLVGKLQDWVGVEVDANFLASGVAFRRTTSVVNVVEVLRYVSGSGRVQMPEDSNIPAVSHCRSGGRVMINRRKYCSTEVISKRRGTGFEDGEEESELGGVGCYKWDRGGATAALEGSQRFRDQA
jgi:hypothetical protein